MKGTFGKKVNLSNNNMNKPFFNLERFMHENQH